MKPFEEAVQPERKTKLEERARQDADLADLNYPNEGMATFSKPPESACYWEHVVHTGEGAVYRAAYNKRIARRERQERGFEQ